MTIVWTLLLLLFSNLNKIYAISPILYYRRFSGNYYPSYDSFYTAHIYCNPGEDCLTSLNTYNYWSTNSSAYSMNSNLDYNCSQYRVFGAKKFGNYDLIKKTFYNLPNHTQIEINFDLLKIDDWNNGTFHFNVDGTNYYTGNFLNEGTHLCSYNENDRIYKISAIINPHINPTLILEFQSFLNVPEAQASYGILNLEIYLYNLCNNHLFCQTCNDSTPSQCNTCPLFSSLNQKGYCVCHPPYYMEVQQFIHCDRCHITCASCKGPGLYDCLSCYVNSSFINGTCASPPNKFRYPIQFPNISPSMNSDLRNWKISNSPSQLISSEFVLYPIVGGYNNFAPGMNIGVQQIKNYKIPHYAFSIFFDIFFMGQSGSFYLSFNSPEIKTFSYLIDNYIQTFLQIFYDNTTEITINFVGTSDLMSTDPKIESWGFNNFQFSLYICHFSCSSCKNLSNYDCLSCYDNATLTISGQCICNTNLFMEFSPPCLDFPCSSCVSTCSLPHYGDPTTFTCVDVCPLNYYGNTVTRICESSNNTIGESSNNTIGECIKTIITPKLKKVASSTKLSYLLIFSLNYSSIYDRYKEKTSISIEGHNMSNESFTIAKTETQDSYQIDLNIDYSIRNLMMNVSFNTPQEIISIYNITLSQDVININIDHFYYIDADTMEIINSTAQSTRFMNNLISDTFAFNNFISLGSIFFFMSLLSIDVINFLKYMEIDYPENVIAILQNQFPIGDIIPNIVLNEEEADANIPQFLQNNQVSKYVFNNCGNVLIESFFYWFVGFLIFSMPNIFQSNLNRFFLYCKHFLIKIFVWNFCMNYFFGNFMQFSFFTFLSYRFPVKETIKGILNFIFSLLLGIILILIYPFMFYIITKINLNSKSTIIPIKENNPVLSKENTKIGIIENKQKNKIFPMEETAISPIQETKRNTIISPIPGTKRNTILENKIISVDENKIISIEENGNSPIEKNKLVYLEENKNVSQDGENKENTIYNLNLNNESITRSKNKSIITNITMINNKSMPLENSSLSPVTFKSSSTRVKGNDIVQGLFNQLNHLTEFLPNENSFKESQSILKESTIFPMTAKKIIEKTKLADKYELLYGDFKHKTKFQSYYIVFKFFKQMIICLILAISFDNPFIGLMIIVIINICYIVVLIIFNPMKTLVVFFKILFNELCVLVATMVSLYLAFMDKYCIYDDELKIKLGWIIVIANYFLLSFYLLMNILDFIQKFVKFLCKITKKMRMFQDEYKQKKQINFNRILKENSKKVKGSKSERN